MRTVTKRYPQARAITGIRNQPYCSLDCLNDHMIYTHTITLETSEGAKTTEEQDNDE